MKKIGITGGIGSGKSIICIIFKVLGVPVFDSDSEAKKLYNKQQVIDELIGALGAEILTDEHKIDLKKIAALVFDDKQKLLQINQIIHPKLAICFNDWCKKNSNNKYVIKEAAVMIESGAHKQCDEIILVTSPLEMRIKRLMQRNNISETDVMKRIEKQMTDEEKQPFAKHIILNNEDKLLIPQILQLHKYYTELE